MGALVIGILIAVVSVIAFSYALIRTVGMRVFLQAVIVTTIIIVSLTSSVMLIVMGLHQLH